MKKYFALLSLFFLFGCTTKPTDSINDKFEQFIKDSIDYKCYDGYCIQEENNKYFGHLNETFETWNTSKFLIDSLKAEETFELYVHDYQLPYKFKTQYEAIYDINEDQIIITATLYENFNTIIYQHSYEIDYKNNESGNFKVLNNQQTIENEQSIIEIKKTTIFMANNIRLKWKGYLNEIQKDK